MIWRAGGIGWREACTWRTWDRCRNVSMQEELGVG